jgi:hypothetical protein
VTKKFDVENPEDMAAMFEDMRPLTEGGHEFAQNALGMVAV